MKALKAILAIALVLVMVFSFAACGGKGAKIDYDKMIAGFVADSLNTFELTIGEEHAPTAQVWIQGSGTGTTTYSSDEKVVTINEMGKVTAVGEGSAYVVITAQFGAMHEVYRYDVYAPAPEADLSNLPAIEGVDFAGQIAMFASTPLNTKELHVGEAHTPTASVWAQNGGTCYTSDAKVVSVAPNGAVTAKARGTAYVVIKSGIGNMFEMYKYIVK